jgi:hypothetical protein
MTEDQAQILSRLLAEIEAATPDNFGFRIRRAWDLVEKLAKRTWQGDEELLSVSGEMWRKMRGSTERALRQNNMESDLRILEVEDRPSLDDLALVVDLMLDYERPRSFRQTANAVLDEALSKELQGNSPARQAAVTALARTRDWRVEAPEAFEVFEPSTPLRSASWSTLKSGTLTTQLFGLDREFSDLILSTSLSQESRDTILKLLRQGNREAADTVARIFDAAADDSVRIACIAALGMLGGCSASIQLSRMCAVAVPPVTQFGILLIETLSRRPYHGPAEDNEESWNVQQETMESVLSQLRSIVTGDPYIVELISAAIAGVEDHLYEGKLYHRDGT